MLNWLYLQKRLGSEWSLVRDTGQVNLEHDYQHGQKLHGYVVYLRLMATRSDLLTPRSSTKNERVAPLLQTFAPFPKMSVRQCSRAINVRTTSGMIESWNRACQACSIQGGEKFNSSNGILWVVLARVQWKGMFVWFHCFVSWYR